MNKSKVRWIIVFIINTIIVLTGYILIMVYKSKVNQLYDNVYYLDLVKVDEYGRNNRRCQTDSYIIYINISGFDCDNIRYIQNGGQIINCSYYCDNDIYAPHKYAEIFSNISEYPVNATHSENCLKINTYNMYDGHDYYKETFFTNCYHSYDENMLYTKVYVLELINTGIIMAFPAAIILLFLNAICYMAYKKLNKKGHTNYVINEEYDVNDDYDDCD